jgi:hypothetical protein
MNGKNGVFDRRKFVAAGAGLLAAAKTALRHAPPVAEAESAVFSL